MPEAQLVQRNSTAIVSYNTLPFLVVNWIICLRNAAMEVYLDALFSVEETARRLGGISVWTVYAWLNQGKLQRTKVGGRTMVREAELQKIIRDDGRSPAPRGQ